MAQEEYNALNERLERIEKLTLLGAKEALTLDECSIVTGYSKNHLYRLTSQRLIPFYKPMGGTLYFKKSEIEDWLLRNRQTPQSEIDSKAATYCITH